MKELKTIFSKPVATKALDGSLAELSYDGLVRVTAANAKFQPTPGAQVLTAESVEGLSCTDPKCLGGSPPAVAWQCSIEIQAAVVTPESGQLLIITGSATSRIAIPVLEASLQGEALADKLSVYREQSGMSGCIGFHVYDICDAGSVTDLAGKRIALPFALCTPA